jgi:hypothetical protein
MLPQARRFFLPAIVGTVLIPVAMLGACGKSDTPEAQVRGVVAAGEEAAEARDLAGLLEHVSPAFRDDRGGGPDELKQYLRGYFVTHQSVTLLTRIESVEFPYRDLARVRLTLGTFGREAAGATGFDLAADVHDVVLELQLEDDEWRVVRAAWQSTRRD